MTSRVSLRVPTVQKSLAMAGGIVVKNSPSIDDRGSMRSRL
jgi:hypothetical protein